MGEQAIDQYKAVLERDPKNINSVKGIAYLYLQMKKFEDAKTFYRKAIELDPNDPEPYYSVAVIDWTQSYQPRMEERAKAGPEAGRVDHEGQEQQEGLRELRDKNSAVIQEGIAMLQKALQLRPDYDDAMAYMNLLYRERGDLECDDPAARAADLKTADEWVDKTMATKKAKAEKQPGDQRHHHAQQVGCWQFQLTKASSETKRLLYFCDEQDVAPASRRAGGHLALRAARTRGSGDCRQDASEPAAVPAL